ncbi:MAG: glycine cleavage system aminomethyltransferase GcvT [Planctomycetia bacterium]|nr:glycine cleavage system aminomethyltransferase GcvT [Planctomycetia bacterium]
MSDIPKTALYQQHVDLGARMVEFAGWMMPVVYTSIVDEHHAVRSHAGLFDIGHMARLSFSGTDALALLEKVCTNNISTMKDGQVRYSLICNELGCILDDVLVYKWPYGYSMVVNASNRTKIVEWLNRHREGMKVELNDQTMHTAMIAVQGPRAIEIVRGLTEVDPASLKYYFAAATRCMGQQCVLSRTGYTGEDGVEIMIGNDHANSLWDELETLGGKPAGLGARDTLRLEASMPLYGHELSESIDPIQAGLSWAVKFDKGAFIGKTAIMERQQKKDLPVRVGLELEGKRPAREGCNIQLQGQTIGTVTSGTFTPTLQKSIAMGYVPQAQSSLGTVVSIDIRGQLQPATVVKMPFYSRPKS